MLSTQTRINLSPFTKDFRVWGAPIEIKPISFLAASWQLPNNEVCVALSFNGVLLCFGKIWKYDF